jgi:hypothetical protein
MDNGLDPVKEVTVWQAGDGLQFDTKEKAETHNLVLGADIILHNVAEQYEYSIEEEEISKLADMLVNTDAMAQLVALFKDKGVI